MKLIILPYVLMFSMVILSFAILACLIRLVIGSSVIDRLLALDTLFLHTTCFIVILGIYWNNTTMFEAALLMTMLGFVSTAALARYFTTGHVID